MSTKNESNVTAREAQHTAKCSKQVATQGGWHFRNCSRPVTVTVDGKHYCTIHSPEKVAERKFKAEAKYESELAKMRLEISAPDLLEALVAIRARIAGEFDNPALVAFGPLGNSLDDCDRIARAAIARAKGGAR